ncbi:MAG: VCBS repeat-containing protein, partial [Planctomycetales bacterium]|nr:VCBS repeat-containing protein [Planctomycetales bacterium]
GDKSNRFGIGAIVQAKIDGTNQPLIRQMSPSTGYLSGNDQIVHFGLGASSHAVELTVDWPSGRRQLVAVPAGATTIRVTEPPSDDTTSPQVATVAPWFTSVTTKEPLRHVEREFDDFQDQPLLPNKLSQFGPGVAVGDVDGDGDEDLFLGGAAGSAGTLWLATDGTFERSDQPAFDADAVSEDMGALLLDVDADDDLDLWVVSGGVESDDPVSQTDRLYLNDGQGKFERADETVLPFDSQSGGVIAAADFDRDGDLDVYVGGRVVPGRYPETPNSTLWVNERGRFVDRTNELAPALMQSGLVTAALWSDVNGDGWCDLVVAHEWGPVKYFQNLEGKLEDQTAAVGLDSLTGWWNSVVALDIDGDQDLDYVVGNFGRNTKYHATLESPAVLYYGDFDKSGKKQLVEAEYEEHSLVPIRGRSCSSNAMPFLRNKFKTYHDFALADLSTLYTEQCLDQAERFAATTLDTGVFVQQTDGRFEFKPLSQFAQISPVFGATVVDADGDGYFDLYLAQNFFEPQAETGRMDSGMSLLLQGGADGQLKSVSPRDSGLIIDGDARGTLTFDWNQDHWPDLLVVQNDGEVKWMQNRGGEDQPRPLEISLRGAVGNRAGIGSRLKIHRADGTVATTEIYAGSGYLSQSSTRILIGRTGSPIAAVTVVWPDGRESQAQVTPDQDSLELTR